MNYTRVTLTNDDWADTGQDGSARSQRATSDVARAIFTDPDTLAFEQRLAVLAPTDATILIIGETGTGKEVAARELHRLSNRKGPFLAVNCAALSESLAESELFGHQRGAFTGAAVGQTGWFEAACGGTLLLDEIGELPLLLQAKLLRVLQEREVTPVGSRTPRRIDTRILAATNVDLHAASLRGSFRRDLLFRLDGLTLTLRPLRERPADVVTLAEHFLRRYGEKYARSPTFSPEALEAISAHDWPGNVRELDNVIQRAVLLNTGTDITATDLQLRRPQRGLDGLEKDGAQALEEVLRRMADTWIDNSEPNLLQRATRILVQAGFDSVGGNQVRAAEVLGVSRNTLRTQLGHLGVIAPRRRTTASETGQQPRLRIGVQKFGSSALLRQDGTLAAMCAAQGIELGWREFSTGLSVVNALHDGDIDIGSTGEIPPIIALANGTRLVYLASEQGAPESVALVVQAQSPMQSISDLRGRRVALSRGANVHLMLVRALNAHGMTLDDIQPVYLPPRVHPAPETIRTVDAWAMWDPFLSDLQCNTGFRVLRDGTGLVANRRFYVARRDCVEGTPGIVADVLASVFRIGEQATRDPTVTANRFAEMFGMNREGLEVAVRRLGPCATWMDDAVTAEQQEIGDLFLKLGIIPRPVSIANAVWEKC